MPRTLKLYSQTIQIAGTVYVKARSEKAARAKITAIANDLIEVDSLARNDGVTLSGADYNDPDLPEVSLSPAMTLCGKWRGEPLELIEETIPDKDPNIK